MTTPKSVPLTGNPGQKPGTIRLCCKNAGSKSSPGCRRQQDLEDSPPQLTEGTGEMVIGLQMIIFRGRWVMFQMGSSEPTYICPGCTVAVKALLRIVKSMPGFGDMGDGLGTLYDELFGDKTKGLRPAIIPPRPQLAAGPSELAKASSAPPPKRPDVQAFPKRSLPAGPPEGPTLTSKTASPRPSENAPGKPPGSLRK